MIGADFCQKMTIYRGMTMGIESIYKVMTKLMNEPELSIRKRLLEELHLLIQDELQYVIEEQHAVGRYLSSKKLEKEKEYHHVG